MAKLTARFVESVRADPGQRLEFTDDAFGGLTLRVTANVKSWTVRYRLPSGERRKLTLGSYPALGLSDARGKAQIALGQVADKLDPAGVKKAERRAARHDYLHKPSTVAELWALYEKIHLPTLRASSQDYAAWNWKKHLRARVGDLRLGEVDRATIKQEIRAIGESVPSTANRSLALMKGMMAFAVENDFVPFSPLAGMGLLFEENARERVLNDEELRTFWRGLDAAPKLDIGVSAAICTALKLCLLTMCRANEMAGLHVREIDRGARSWTIPAARAKGGADHVIPLGPLAWRLLGEAFGSPDPDKWAGYAFPNRVDRGAPLDRHSLTRAMARIVKAYKIGWRDGDDGLEQVERTTVHDLRRSAATFVASERIGTPPHLVSALLGHSIGGARVTAVYVRHKYDREKRDVLERWEALVVQIANNGLGTEGCELSHESDQSRS